MTIRMVLATFLIGSLIFFQHEYRIYSFPVILLYYFVCFVYALTGAYWFLLGKIGNLTFFAYFQSVGDILLVTFLVHLTGGIDSSFSILYYLTIISASIITYRRGGYFAASLAGIIYGGMLDLQYYEVLGFVRSENFTSVQVLHLVFVNIISFYMVALLSGYLSDRLRKTREELREKNLDFKDLRVLQDHILKSVASGILTIDLGGKITSWNRAAEQITGYSYDEIKLYHQDVFAESIKRLFGHTDELKETAFRFEGRILKKDGTTALLGMVASLLKDEQETIRGIILIFEDITKIVEMEEQFRRQERLATVGSLAAGIAHEIRNPLASLSGSVQILQGELDLKDDNKHLMEIVVREADRLNTIITDFLEYARPKTDQNEPVLLSSALDETITLLRNSREFSDSFNIRCAVDPNITIRGDGQRLRQVFWNLLINARHAMPEGGEIAINARIVSSDDDDYDWCEITVADTGHGIEREYLDKIFDPFFTTKLGGTGLGLAIVYRIIDDHGGSISVETRAGKGTKFRIRMPVAQEPAYFETMNGQIRKRFASL